MCDIFKTICALSISGTILMLLLVMAKLVLKKYIKKTVFFYLWCIVLLRFILPIPSVVVKAPTVTTINQQPAAITNQTQAKGTYSLENTSNKENDFVQNEALTPTPIVKERPSLLSVNVWSIAVWVWVVGMLLIGTYQVTAYIRYKKSVIKTAFVAQSWVQEIMGEISEGRKVAVLCSRKVKTPMLIGTSILLPIKIVHGADRRLMSNVLQHEWMHYKNKDIWLKWLCIAIATIHWFNPFVWILVKEFEKNCELACDERVTSKMNMEEKVLYGETLLRLSVKTAHSNNFTLAMSKEKKYMKERLISIMNRRIKPRISLVLSILLIVALSGCAALTGTPNSTKPENNDAGLSEAPSKELVSTDGDTTKGQRPIYSIIDEDKVLNTDKYLQEQATKAKDGYVPPVLILVEPAKSSTMTIAELPSIELEQMAQEIVKTAYELTGCQFEMCYYQPSYDHGAAISFLFSMGTFNSNQGCFLAGTIDTKNGVVYDIFISNQPFFAESYVSVADTPYKASLMKRPENYKTMSDEALAKWYFSNLEIAQGKKIVNVYRDMDEDCEAIQIYLEDGTCYEMHFTGERVPQMLYGPFDGKHVYPNLKF